MSDGNREALDDQIGLLRRQIADLTEEAAAASGVGQEQSLADQLNQKQERLNELLELQGQADNAPH